MNNNKVYNLLKKINAAITLTLFVIAAYLIILPITPNISFKLAKAQNNLSSFNYNSEFLKQTLKLTNYLESKEIPEQNTLLIPSILINSEIIEGETEKALENGIWRIPYSSTPDKGSNTVLVAHRFLYTFGSNTFFHLDKVKKGDYITIFWNSKEYNYEVFDIQVVTPIDTFILAPTEESILTLYTCDPLWTAKNRLVVKAKLINTNENE